jgi:hypothetical protein
MSSEYLFPWVTSVYLMLFRRRTKPAVKKQLLKVAEKKPPNPTPVTPPRVTKASAKASVSKAAVAQLPPVALPTKPSQQGK